MTRNVPTFLIAATLALTGPALADEQTDALFDALMLPELLDVMQQEGLNYGESVGQDLFGGTPSADWYAVVADIYEAERMQTVVRADFAEALEGQDLGPILEFFSTDLGQQIVSLEVTAREAMLDDAVEEAARETAAIAMADETERYKLVERFVEANDLIETNVVGSMNSNVAFYMGLADGGAFAGELTEDQILSDVWGQEGEIRASTSEWVYSFLMMAYQPLEDSELQAYIAFSETEAGAALNAALFEAFEDFFDTVSRGLGLAAADLMTAQEL